MTNSLQIFTKFQYFEGFWLHFVRILRFSELVWK